MGKKQLAISALVLGIALAITLGVAAASRSPPLAKWLASGATFGGAFVAVQNLLSILKLTEENRNLREQRDGRVYRPSTGEINRFLSKHGSKLSLMAVAVFICGVGWASALLAIQQQERIRALEQRLSRVSGDAKAEGSKRDAVERQLRDKLDLLTDVNAQLAQQVAHQEPSHASQTPQPSVIPPRQPRQRGGAVGRLETRPSSSNNLSQHQMENAPQLTVDGLQDRDLTISVIGPIRLTFIVGKGQSKTVGLVPGNFVIKAAAAGMPGDQSALQAKGNMHYVLSFSLKSSEVVSKKP